MNHLVTGPPRSGKTTVLERIVARVAERGGSVGGVVTAECRADGERVGFRCRALDTGETALLASVDRDCGPAVGRYRVDVAAIDDIAAPAVERARETADVVVIDEIAPMQRHSEQFVAAAHRALDGPIPVVAAVATGDEILARPDVTVHEVTPETRDELPVKIVSNSQI